MKRRQFIGKLAGGMVAASFLTRLRAAEKVWRIGYLGGTPGGPPPMVFAKALEALGYVDGKNIKIEWRHDGGNQALIPDMAADLVRLNVDLIVAGSSAAGHPAQKATTTIPIVVITSHDGVGSGLYGSLAHPGGNITGLDSMAPELDAKRVEMLKEMVPKLSRLTVLYNSSMDGAKIHADVIMSAAAKFNIVVRFVDVRTVADFDAAFAAILSDRPEAVLTVADPLIFVYRKRIVDFGAEHELPMVHEFKQFVELGGLASYGPDILEIFRRGASYVDKIFKGEKPGDIPVEQPTKFDLAINLKAAKAVGITFPNTLLASANVVIE
jgi:putative ABC transport system substrate-binding protein